MDFAKEKIVRQFGYIKDKIQSIMDSDRNKTIIIEQQTNKNSSELTEIQRLRDQIDVLKTKDAEKEK